MGRMKLSWLLLGVFLLTVSIYDVSADVTPSENECRPYIEKAIHDLKNTETTATDNDESTEDATNDEQEVSIEANESLETDENDQQEQAETGEEVEPEQPEVESTEDENTASEEIDESSQENVEKNEQSVEEEGQDGSAQDTQETEATEEKEESVEEELVRAKRSLPDEASQPEQDNSVQDDNESQETAEDTNKSAENEEEEEERGNESDEQSQEVNATNEEIQSAEIEEELPAEANDSEQVPETANDDNDQQSNETGEESQEIAEDSNKSVENEEIEQESDGDEQSHEDSTAEDETQSTETDAEVPAEASDSEQSQEISEAANDKNDESSNETAEEKSEAVDESQENSAEVANEEESGEENEPQSEETMPEEDLTLEFEIPKNLRSRDHINALLGLDAESSIKENALRRTGDVVLKELKKIYDNSVKPLETLYKYRDLSNRHFGDPEIFSKPLILFMGPWSGGKSTILNYLTDNEYTPNSIRSGAEPSPAYFNILMHGDEPEVLDGTQLAADWTFSGLQKFGQGLNDRLRGQRLPNKLLERVNIVEIPGILEVRKQVSRYFPFNDACQWFIDRADIIFLVYDPSKLDVGPETEAILDQLKGREYQTRILLNKADQVKPEELLRVQSALIWNISPLMSSAQPPVMYTVSLWSHPFEVGAPTRLLQAQERAFLVDLREAIDKRIENKIASARRFAVRIRNHAKMVDCYLTTYYNQKTLFSNKKQISDKIIEHPQNYNIYEGLSTLTNISRYDLPDPEVYLDFFRLNPLYNFKKLAETCTYFKGCPINKLDISIAYDLPELVGKYKSLLIENLGQLRKEYEENCNQSDPEPPIKIIKSS